MNQRSFTGGIAFALTIALSLTACKNEGPVTPGTADGAAMTSSPGSGAGNSATGATGGTATGGPAASPGATGGNTAATTPGVSGPATATGGVGATQDSASGQPNQMNGTPQPGTSPTVPSR